MTIRPTRLATQLGLAFGSVMLMHGGAFAQTSLERVEITGSRIKRVEAESANPVLVIGRSEIERSGVSNINELLQRIDGAGAGLDDRVTNGFAPGGGGLNLRNLGFNSTLVLINGRRMPTYPFAQQVGTSQGFNDLQNIPIAAVDRIEVLKDGASAVYGADAVAGVVNIILRNNYTGVEASASLGRSSRSDGNAYTVGLTGGTGSLETDKYNILVGVNISKSNEVKSKNRPWGNTEDLRSQGGSDLRSSYGFPGTITDNVDANAAPVFTGACGPVTQQGGSSERAGFCRYDRPQFGSLLPENEKIGIYSKLNAAITTDITAFAEVLLTQNKFTSTSWPAGSTDDVGIGSDQIPAGSSANPFPNDASVRTRFADVGDRQTNGTSNTSRLVLGLKGASAGWDWEAATNVNRVKIDSLATNNALTSRVMCVTNPAAAAAYAAGGNPLGLGTLDQIFAGNPSAAAYFKSELAKCGAAAGLGLYNYPNPSANAPGMASYLRHDSTRLGDSTLNGFDAHASHELMDLAGGAMAIAVGVERRKEKVQDIPDIQLQSGDTLSISAAQAFGSRSITSIYSELVAPFSKAAEVSFALRRDKYTGSGEYAATSPKIGLKLNPMQGVLVRATASEAFRAPSLFETTPAQQTSFAFSLQDKTLCPTISDTNPDCALDVRRVQSGNPNLKPEKSRAYTLGVVLEASKSTSVSVDLWKIKRSDEIGAFDDQKLVDVFGNDPNIVVRDSTGHISQINVVPIQLNGTKTWGIDTEVVNRSTLGDFGTLDSKVSLGYVGSYKFATVDSTGATVVEEFNGTYNQPRLRASWDFALTSDAWEYSVGGYMIGGYEGLRLTEHVKAMDIWNAGVSYKPSKNMTIKFQIANLFDQRPRFDDESSGSNAGYNPQLADPMGRYFKIGLQYKF